MNVPCRASERRQARFGHGGGQDRVPRHAAHDHRGAHQAEAEQHPGRAWPAAGCRRSGPARCARSASRARNAAASPARPIPALRAAARRRSRPSRLDASRLGRRRSAGQLRPEIGRPGAEEHAGALAGGRRPRHGDGVGVGLQHLAGDGRPGVARRVRPRLDGHRGAALGRHGEVAQGLGQGRRVAAREEHAVDPVAHDVAIAGDVGGDDRRAGGERLGEHHAEALAAQRGRDQQVGGGQRRGLLGVGDLAQHGDALRAVEHERLDLVAIGAHDDELDRDVVAQRLEGAQQHGKPLALDRLADEGQAQRRARRPRRGASGSSAGTSTPLGMIR